MVIVDKSKMEIALKHVAVCGNPTPNCFDIAPNAEESEVIAFGRHKTIVLYKVGKNCEKLIPHSVFTYNFSPDVVSSMQWSKSFELNKQGYQVEHNLITGDTTGNITISKYNPSKLFCSDSLELISTFKFLKDAIHSVDGISYKSNEKTTCTVAAAGCQFVSILTRFGAINEAGTWTEPLNHQEIDLSSNYALGVKLHCLQNSGAVVLACACSDFKVRLYTNKCSGKLEKSEDQFSLATVLLGHEDWASSVSFKDLSLNTWLLVTTSHDSTIRVWKIEDETDKIQLDNSKRKFLQLKKQNFKVKDTESSKVYKYSIGIDTVLESHEGKVYSAEWNVSKANNKIQMLTASIDKNILVWEYDEENKMWIDIARVGEQGGNTLGFYKAMFTEDGKGIIGYGYNGSLYYWKSNEQNVWQSNAIISGHSDVVQDIDWERSGKFLLSTSSDMTTRLFSEWCKSESKSWHEMARPQIHGYEMKSVSMLSGNYFASGGDEKVVRAFEAPKNFIENFTNLSGQTLGNLLDAPQGAAVPALGLSNKAVFSVENQVVKEKSRNDQYIDNLFQNLSLSQPPFETDLLQNTLWPEVQKMYGHVYEIFALAANKTGTLFATASKSKKEQHSSIKVWQTGTWNWVGELKGHNLTVTQIEFSPDNKYLLSVSRDRKWCLFKIENSGCNHEDFSLVAQSDKKTGHTRIIWSCSWSNDSAYFFTGSRDKSVIMWGVGEDAQVTRQSKLNCEQPVTAVSCSPNKQRSFDYSYLLAVGLESGDMKLCAVDQENNLHVYYTFGKNICHAAAVLRLKWRPNDEYKDDDGLCLASCSQDCQIKLFDIKLV